MFERLFTCTWNHYIKTYFDFVSIPAKILQDYSHDFQSSIHCIKYYFKRLKSR